MGAAQPSLEERILILAPTGRDATLVSEVLGRANLRGEVMASAVVLGEAMGKGVGAVLISEEALSPHAMSVLSDTLSQQPPWSDLPIVIFAVPTRSDASAARLQRMLDVLGNVTVIERPFGVGTLLTAVRAALRGRLRQYAARATLVSLQTQEAALKRADQRKDEFLAMLAHELRNPLAAISMALTLMERSPSEVAQSTRHREMARRQMRNLIRLVDDLLDVSRITRGVVELRRQNVDLTEILHSAISAARPVIESRQHSLSLTVGPGRFPMHADATRLEQVVTNLLSNAAKYTEPSGRISVELKRASVEGRDAAILTVEDTGRGIPAHMLDRVFEQFVQVDQSLDRTMGGLGLGLTLVKALVEMHGGAVRARSRGANLGSVFEVRLPLGRESADAQAAPLEPSGVKGACERRIVLVEDSDDIREAMREYLESLGHEVFEAADGIEGVERILRVEPDIAIVDVGLPGADGYEVAQRVRAARSDRNLYLVALTGYGGEDAKAQAKAAGFDLHLTKPVNIADLSALLERVKRA